MAIEEHDIKSAFMIVKIEDIEQSLTRINKHETTKGKAREIHSLTANNDSMRTHTLIALVES